MASQLIFYTTLLLNVRSEYIDCSPQTNCGPCITADCNLNCASSEICKGSDKTLTCHNHQNCQIICNGSEKGKACLDANINIQNTTNATVNCVAYEDCKNTKLQTQNTHSLIVNCMQTQTKAQNCQDMTIDASFTSSVQLNCDGYISCQKLYLKCGIDCIVNCNDNGGNVCEGLNLVCGTGKCQINCEGNMKCTDISINTDNALTFECIGSDNDCAMAPAPFTLEPTIATAKPSVNPSVYSANVTVIMSTNVPSMDRRVIDLDTTHMSVGQNGNERDYFDINLRELPDFVYMTAGAVIAMYCMGAVVCIYLYGKKEKNAYANMSKEQNMESEIMKYEKKISEGGEDNRTVEGMEWIENDMSLDCIENKIKHFEDDIVQHINRTDAVLNTCGSSFDLDLRINDFQQKQ